MIEFYSFNKQIFKNQILKKIIFRGLIPKCLFLFFYCFTNAITYRF